MFLYSIEHALSFSCYRISAALCHKFFAFCQIYYRHSHKQRLTISPLSKPAPAWLVCFLMSRWNWIVDPMGSLVTFCGLIQGFPQFWIKRSLATLFSDLNALKASQEFYGKLGGLNPSSFPPPVFVKVILQKKYSKEF